MKIQQQRCSGFSLIEVTVAMGVAAFCLVIIIGLLPVGLNSNQASINLTVAASLARGIASDLRATPKTSPATIQNSPLYQIPVPITGSTYHTLYLKQDTTVAGTIDANATAGTNPLYRVSVVFTVPPAQTSYYGTVSGAATVGATTLVYARILISWPALADPTWNAAPTKFAGSYEVYLALDRSP